MAEVKDMIGLVGNIIDSNNAAKQDRYKELNAFTDSLANLQLGDDLTASLVAVLELPDEQFKIISPMLLMEFNKDFHDSNNQLLMLQSLNAQGYNLADLLKEVNDFVNIIDTGDFDLNQSKKDFLKQLFMDMFNAVSEIQGIPKHVIEVPIELCNKDAKIPAYANPTDSGMDIYALEDITINPGETVLVPTGIKVAIPVGYELQVRPKSGRSLKTKLRVANTPGTIDAGYRDEIGVIIDNIDPPIKKIYRNDNGTIAAIDYGSSYTIGKGEKFAQLVLVAVNHCAFTEVEHVSAIANDGRNGGFGSTGIK